MNCLCVNVYYCHRVTTQLQLTNISYHNIINIIYCITPCSLVPIYRIFSARRYYIFQGRGISCQIIQLLVHTTVAEPFFPHILCRCGSDSDSPTLKMNAGDPPERLVTIYKTHNTTSWMKVTSAVTSFRTSNFTTSFGMTWKLLL
jgi:hypothetical protein